MGDTRKFARHRLITINQEVHDVEKFRHITPIPCSYSDCYPNCQSVLLHKYYHCKYGNSSSGDEDECANNGVIRTVLILTRDMIPQCGGCAMTVMVQIAASLPLNIPCRHSGILWSNWLQYMHRLCIQTNSSYQGYGN